MGVLDIDSPYFNRFTLNDQDFLEKIVEIIAEYILKKDNVHNEHCPFYILNSIVCSIF